MYNHTQLLDFQIQITPQEIIVLLKEPIKACFISKWILHQQTKPLSRQVGHNTPTPHGSRQPDELSYTLAETFKELKWIIDNFQFKVTVTKMFWLDFI